LRETVLDRTDLRGARYDASTLWPDSFLPLEHSELIGDVARSEPATGSLWRWAFAGITAATLLADQGTKAAVEASVPLHATPVPVAGGLLSVTHVRNTGIALNLFQDSSIATLVGTTAVLVGILALALHRSRDPERATAGRAVGYGLLVGGGIGNLIDRARLGAVTDFIRLGDHLTLNVGDLAVTAGLLLLAGAGAHAALGQVPKSTAVADAAANASSPQPRPVPIEENAS
jgi:signal peptidase II